MTTPVIRAVPLYNIYELFIAMWAASVGGITFVVIAVLGAGKAELFLKRAKDLPDIFRMPYDYIR